MPRVLEDTGNVWETWKQVIRETGLAGLRVHDAYIAAVMKEHHIETLMTLNVRDFQTIPGLTIIVPQNWQIWVEIEDHSR